MQLKDQRATLLARGNWWVIPILAGHMIVIGLLLFTKHRDGWAITNPYRLLTLGHDEVGVTKNPILTLPNVVVGLHGSGPADKVYVDVAFDLEVGSEQDREALRQRLPRLRNETIEFLSDLRPDELRGSGELARTKSRLLARYSNVVPERRLKALYLSYLVVGRLE